MQVTKTGSVRVDLVGGTLDIDPIHLILKNVVTLNVATSLKAKVVLTSTKEDFVEIISEDYNSSQKFMSSEFTEDNLYFSSHFGPMTFVCQILDFFHIHNNIKIELSSGAPAGSGLGGSSAMGITFMSALCDYTKSKKSKVEMITKVKSAESRILNQGTPGYQDYYPALYGGILGLKPKVGEIEVDQLYTEELKNFLETHITLVYSGISRHSGINNWEVYKAFFDKNEATRKGMAAIAEISHKTYMAIKEGRYQDVLSLIGQEGETRKKLFPGIVNSEIQSMYNKMKESHSHIGLKMCGAGGGGCFIITHAEGEREALEKFITQSGMKILEFKIEKPLND